MSDQLWAPWRYDYIRSVDSKTQKPECVFCDLFAGSDDRNNLILYRGKTCFVLLNAYPYTSGHLMVAPIKHVSSLVDLNDEELLEMNKLVARTLGWLKEAYQPHGFNVGMNLGKAAGAGIPSHLHCHVVPRWDGDTNFMTPVGGVRVIPQSLLSAYDLIKEHMDE